MPLCSLCGRDRKVLLTVGDPKGAVGTGKPFELCGSCWTEGARGDKLGNVKNLDDAPRPKKGDKMGRSLATGETYVATGEVIIRGARVPDPAPERSKAKADVGSFDKHPNGPEAETELAYTGGIQYVPDGDGYW